MVRSIDSVAMRDVAVWILHPEPGAGAGPLERWVAAERSRIAERHRDGFLRAGAATARIVSGPPDDTSFGARLRGLVEEARPGPGGVIVLGSGAIPLATIRDRRSFVATAAAATPTALANNRYSADVVSIAVRRIAPRAARPARRQRAPALAGGGGRVPGRRPAAPMAARVRRRRATRPAAHGSRGRFARRRRRNSSGTASAPWRRSPQIGGPSCVVAGRTSAATLRWLETAAACTRPGACRGTRHARSQRPCTGRRPVQARTRPGVRARPAPRS